MHELWLPLKNGEKIYGRLYVACGPDGKEATTPTLGWPIVVASHGLGGNCAHSDAMAADFNAQGLAYFAFDFRGAPGAKSSGDSLNMTVSGECEDLNAVIDGLQSATSFHLDIARRLFLIGMSQGGLVSALVAASRPADVRALALLYPAFNIPDDAKARFASSDDVPETFDIMGVKLGRAYHSDAISLNVWDSIGAYKGDVLISHGIDDEAVPIDYSRHAARIYEHATLVEVEGAGHGFGGGFPISEVARAARFFAAHI